MVEKAQNPTEKKSQSPDTQTKTTIERTEKQTIEPSPNVTKGDFTKATVAPDKEG